MHSAILLATLRPGRQIWVPKSLQVAKLKQYGKSKRLVPFAVIYKVLSRLTTFTWLYVSDYSRYIRPSVYELVPRVSFVREAHLLNSWSFQAILV